MVMVMMARWGIDTAVAVCKGYMGPQGMRGISLSAGLLLSNLSACSLLRISFSHLHGGGSNHHDNGGGDNYHHDSNNS